MNIILPKINRQKIKKAIITINPATIIRPITTIKMEKENSTATVSRPAAAAVVKKVTTFKNK